MVIDSLSIGRFDASNCSSKRMPHGLVCQPPSSAATLRRQLISAIGVLPSLRRPDNHRNDSIECVQIASTVSGIYSSIDSSI